MEMAKIQQLTEDVIKHHTRMPILFVFKNSGRIEEIFN